MRYAIPFTTITSCLSAGFAGAPDATAVPPNARLVFVWNPLPVENVPATENAPVSVFIPLVRLPKLTFAPALCVPACVCGCVAEVPTEVVPPIQASSLL